MKKVTIATQKGGSGKSVLARHLAVAATLRGYKAAILDADQQETSLQWFRQRTKKGLAAPTVTGCASVTRDSIEEAIDAQEKEGVELLFIDTAGHMNPAMPLYAARSDLVLVPVRPTGDDVNALPDTIEVLSGRKAPYFVVPSQVMANAFGNLEWLLRRMQRMDVPTLKTAIHHRNIVINALAGGSTALEVKRPAPHEKKAVEEFRAAFDEIESLLSIKPSGNLAI